MKPSRILFLVNAFETDAPTSLCLEVARGAAAAGHVVQMIALSRGGPLEPRIQEAGIRHSSLNGSALQLYRDIRQFRPQIVQCILAKPTLIGAPIAWLARVPIVISVHHGSHEWGEKGRLSRVLVPRWFRLASRVVDKFVSVSISASIELKSIGIPEAKIAIIRNGVDSDCFKPGGGEERLRIRQELFPAEDPAAISLIGSLGNLRPVKGYEQLINAAPEVLQQHPSARFVIWGEGELRDFLLARIHNLNLADHFVLPGHTDNAAVALRACDIYVQPSMRESFGLATAEAMACALPVVVSSAGGLPELVGDAGLNFSDGSQGLAASINSLLSDPAECARLGQLARERVLAHFTGNRMVQDYLRLFETQLKAASARD